MEDVVETSKVQSVGTPHDMQREALRPLGVAGWLLVALAVTALTASVFGLFFGGIGWDSRFDTDATAIARSLEVNTLQEAYDAVPVTTEFYGLLVYQLADLGHMWLTGASDLFGPDDQDAYFWQGLVTIIFSAVSAIAFAWALSVVTRRQTIGAAGAALLLSTPLWLGSSTVNYKDMPVAAGITIFSSALAVTVSRQIRGRSWFAPLVWASLGACMSFGTRAGSFVLLIAIALGSVGYVILVQWKDRSRWWPPIVVSCVSLVVSLAFLVATNPIARLGPIQWLRDSWAYSTGGFPWVATMRTAGVEVPSNAITWWYIPAWLLAQLPILTTMAAVVGLVIVLRDVVTEPLTSMRARWPWLVPFLIQGLVLPTALMLRHIELYDGIRHLLFILPAFIVLAVVPLATLDSWQGKAIRRTRTLAAVVGLVVVGSSLFAALRWFPYSYAFINPIAGWNKDARHWELDYWGVSAREGLRTLGDLGVPPRAVIPYNDPARPFDPTITQIPGDNPSGQPFGYYWFARWEFPSDIPFDCQDLFEIRRDGHLIGKGGSCR